MRRTRLVLSAALAILVPIHAAAEERPAPTVDLSAGWAAFADDSWIHHRTTAAAVRFYITPRCSVGPEVTYMIGPDTDRDLFVFGNAAYEWPMLIQDGLPRVVPYVIGGWGYFRHRSQFGAFIWHGTAWAGGPGLRVRVTDRMFVAPELRFGSELDVRMIGVVSWRLRPS